jgi:hypothetical protein
MTPGRYARRRAALPLAGLALGLLIAGAPTARPATAGALHAPPTSGQLAALERMNAYRRLAGVAPLRLDDALDRAAMNHAAYYILNFGDPALTGMGLHDEQPGKPGFTGVDMETRIRQAGYTGTWNEGIALLGDPARAVDEFMTNVNHRLPILDPAYTDTGYGGAAQGRAVIDVFTYGGQGARPTPPEFVAYPPDGMTGAALTYQGAETNAAFPGAHYPVGSAITLKYTGPGALALASAVVTGPDGAPLPTLTHANYNFITHNVIALAADKPLRPASRYSVRVDGTRNGVAFTLTWTFTTVAAGQAPGPGPVPTGAPPPVPTGARAPLPTPTGVPTTAPPAGPELSRRFAALWARLDGPLAAGRVTRSWAWGPAPLDTRTEPYREGPGGQRQVQYYDKSRMEINDPGAAPTGPWYITNGLLVTEMVSGQMQVGEAAFLARAPSQEPVAGDSRQANPDAPSYAAMRGVTSINGDHTAPDMTGRFVTTTLDSAGSAGATPSLVDYAVRLARYAPETRHNIADRFWTYLTQQGPVYTGGALRTEPLFAWIYVTGYPISEPYWITARIAGKPYPALVQLFQRRTLTYVPAFAPEWQTQMGNVGRHYHAWRYGGS